ncbi:MAG: hypothetical protein ACI4KM_03595 [Oscillospiraceae bacterium]
MEQCRLFIVEGLPCSGKSTASRFIADELAKQGKNVRFFDECQGNHPADYEFSAYISESKMNDFSIEEQAELKSHSEKRCGGYIVELGALQGELFNKALKFKIYDFLDWNTEMPVMLEKWHRFGQSVKDNEIFVLNCCFVQNPMCETMMRFNFMPEQSEEYIAAIYNEIKHLHPKVIYMLQADIAQSINRALPERGKQWLDSVIDYHVNGAYGKSAGLMGFEGYVECLAERQKRETEILRHLQIPTLFCCIENQEWDNAYSLIRQYITEE